jgi:hypothetical protein
MMRDETIRIGDLVMVVKPTPCCGDASDIGTVFYVRWVGMSDGECLKCGHTPAEEPAADNTTDLDDGCYPFAMLKKINPPPLEQSTKTRDEVTA